MKNFQSENLKRKINLLINLYKSKKLSEATLLSKELISTYPKVVFLYNILGLILTDQGKIEEAIKIYEKGIKIKPDYAGIYNNLGNIYKLKENYSKAENYYKKSINLDNKLADPHNNLGNLYRTLNKHKKAIVCYKNAININPKYFTAHYNLGITYKSIGKFKEAKIYLKESVKLNTYFYTAHRILSQITSYTLTNDHFKLLKKLHEDPKIGTEHKTELVFALGKASEDVKNFDQAFQYYTEGNDLRRKEIVFSKRRENEEFDNIKKFFNKNLFEKFKKFGNLDLTPIFIIGMPRSGTTLVEQILSNHPKVFGGDELNLLPDLVNKYFYNKGRKLFLKDIVNINKEKLKKIGQEYISELKKISCNSERVTDKLPINFKWVGLIKLLLPNSKVIHCVRNSRDNCLSIFKNYFANKELNFAYNLDELSGYYNLYCNLMKYWNSTLLNFVIDIKYEKLVKNPEQQIRNLLKACNLQWNDNCLKFYNNKRAIKTASDVQARKKIYKSAIDSWKNYDDYLNDFFQKLS